MEQVNLSMRPAAYDGNPQRMEVLEYSTDIHEGPGVYLQHVEGCGYTVFDLTVDEAVKLGTMLIQSAVRSRDAFSKVNA